MEKVEYLSPQAWEQWHTELLQSTVNRAYNRVPFYREKMKEMGVGPDDIGSVSDIVKLPFTTRDDLADNYPYGLFSVPLRDIVRIHTLASGWSQSSSNPIALGYTCFDLRRRTELTKRFFTVSGVSPDDIVQICLDPGLSLHGQDLKEGAEALGALVIPPDPVSTLSRIRVMMDFKTTVLVTTPSYGLHLLDVFKRENLPLAALNLKLVILLGETLKEEVRQIFEQELEVETRAAYGIFEASGPAMAYECIKKSGLHLALDHVIPEIVHPETGEQLPPGHRGELVITTVTARANPLIRFRTGDLTTLNMDTCDCGRTTWRMDQVFGRCDTVFSVRGVKVSPVQIGRFLASCAQGHEIPYLVILHKCQHLTNIELLVAMDESIFNGSLPDLHNWIRNTEEAFLETFGLRCRIRPVEIGSIQGYLDKGQIVVNGKTFYGS